MIDYDRALEESEEIERAEREAYERYLRDYAEAREKYPNACESCGGGGVVYSTYDPSPPGVSLSPGFMVDAEPCPDCVERGRCPRCGGGGLDLVEVADERTGLPDDHFECGSCGWDERAGEAVLPSW